MRSCIIRQRQQLWANLRLVSFFRSPLIYNTHWTNYFYLQQSCFRGHRDFMRYLMICFAAIRVQACMRGYFVRRNLWRLKGETTEHAAATVIVRRTCILFLPYQRADLITYHFNISFCQTARQAIMLSRFSTICNICRRPILHHQNTVPCKKLSSSMPTQTTEKRGQG